MDATVYTGIGTGGNLPVVNAAGFKPDLIWGKNRTSAAYHVLVDSNRGSSKFSFSNLAGAEGTSGTPVFSINNNGFTASYNNANFNELSSSIVAWQWQAGQGTNNTNTNGSITSSVSVNASAGFSIVTYTGNGTAGATIGHGLGVAPHFIINVIRDTVTQQNHVVYHVSIGNTAALKLNNSDAQTVLTGYWNDTSPTSSVFSVGTFDETNKLSTRYVAYCWTPIAGYSSFGSYTGNNSSDGTFVYTGFRPKFLMVKNYSAAGYGWPMWDSSRSPYNVSNIIVAADNSANEATFGSTFAVDFLSNGFKFRTSDVVVNNGSYIYMAFAENPFKNSLAR
jgi:hypothetical protein